MHLGKICYQLSCLIKALARPKNIGWCTVCSSRTLFVEFEDWLRDHYKCIRCGSIPRNRALIQILATHFPEYGTYRIHESSPSGPASEKIARDCSGYVPTQLFPDIPYGEYSYGVRCENLERMTFPDSCFDLVITQDVFEHVMNPDRAFADIARTLRPGGAHVFTVPLFEHKHSLVRAEEINGKIIHHEKPEYHGNPVDEKGALVVREWGEDIVDYIYQSSGMSTTVYRLQDRSLGIDGDFLEVLVSRKLA